jgi:hypothetical protein
VQDKITDARVHAERALAAAMQQHASGAGMSEWARQVIDRAGTKWFGGMHLQSLGPNTTAVASTSVKQLEESLELITVRPFRSRSTLEIYLKILMNLTKIRVNPMAIRTIFIAVEHCTKKQSCYVPPSCAVELMQLSPMERCNRCCTS